MPLIAILAATLVSFCWGANFSASKLAVQYLPPYLTIFIRFVGLSLLLLPFIRRYGWPNWKEMGLLSLFYITLHFAMFFAAMRMGLSVSSTIVASQLGVPFSCLLASIFFKDFLGPWRSFGLILAFFGVVVVAGAPDVEEHSLAFLVALIGAFGWAAANIHMKRMRETAVIPMLFWPGLLALPQMLVLSLIFEHDQLALIAAAPLELWLAIAYSILFSSMIGYGLWTWLLSRYEVTQVVPYSLLIPVFGISSGMILFGETLTPPLILGAVLTVVGVAIITLRRPKLAELDQG
ncbi:MAG: EamA family transporter [Rickettsiales bacterium]|nr:EamA family transporter [Rickettsiales bacterium]